MKHFKIVVLASVLISICCLSSGCATILGGIIGHQSGELAAGLAIGAALDFGDNVVIGVGQMLTDQQEEFREKTLVDSDKGEIELSLWGFSVDHTKELLSALQGRFKQAGWSYRRAKLDSCFDLFSLNYTEKQIWACETDAPAAFNLDIEMGWHKNPKIAVKVSEGSTADRSAITNQIYNWLEEIVLGSAANDT